MYEPLTRTLAKHLRKPSGLFGRLVMSRLLNWANAGLNRAALDLLDLKPEDRVLEVGFGGGDLIARMTPGVTSGSITGLDYSPDIVALGERRFRHLILRGRLELRCASVEAMPYEDGRFTKACTINTIYFWPDPARALRELHRVLTDGGLLVVGFRTRASLERHSFAQYQKLYEGEEVRLLMVAAGLRDVDLVPGRDRLGEFTSAVGRRGQEAGMRRTNPVLSERSGEL